MDHIRHALLRQRFVQRAHVLRKGQAGLGQLAGQKLVELILLNVDAVAVFRVLAHDAQRNHADAVARKLLVAQITGGIRYNHGFTRCIHSRSPLSCLRKPAA